MSVPARVQVTAGHDNFWNQSFPFVTAGGLGPPLQALGVQVRTLRTLPPRLPQPVPLIAAAGAQLDISNYAMGNNPVVPAMACVETTTGARVRRVQLCVCDSCKRPACAPPPPPPPQDPTATSSCGSST